MGFTWEHIRELNPSMIVASVIVVSDGHHYEDLKCALCQGARHAQPHCRTRSEGAGGAVALLSLYVRSQLTRRKSWLGIP